MWIGGVRVVIVDDEGKILMVSQHHEGKDIWMVPGGAMEEGENALEAAIREVREETGLEVKIKRLLWHVEEVNKEKGHRFVNYFLAEITGGQLGLGSDPEFDEENQVLREIKFFCKGEMMGLENLHPRYLKTELWEALEPRYFHNEVFKIRY